MLGLFCYIASHLAISFRDRQKMDLLTSLPTELLQFALCYISLDPPSLEALRCTNHLLRLLSGPLLYHSVELPIGWTSDKAILKQQRTFRFIGLIASVPEIAPLVQKVKLS